MELDRPFSVTVHPYRSIIRGSCCYEMGDVSSKNAIVFLGGLSDGPHTSPFIRSVSSHIAKATDLSYSIFEVRMRSAYTSYGTSSIANDVEDISAVVKYLRGIGRQRILLLGHSTGCQVCTLWLPQKYLVLLICVTRTAWSTPTMQDTRILLSMVSSCWRLLRIESHLTYSSPIMGGALHSPRNGYRKAKGKNVFLGRCSLQS